MFFFLFKELTVHENPELDKGRYAVILFVSSPLTCYQFVVTPGENFKIYIS